MRRARAVWLTVAVLVLLGLLGLGIVARGQGGPQALISALQTHVIVRQTQSAAEATRQTQISARQTQSAAEATEQAARAPLAATVRALETQVARLQEASTPSVPSLVLGTPGGGAPP